MRHEAQLARRGAECADASERRGELARREPEPVHAGVDLEPQRQARRIGRAFEELDLRAIVHHEVEPLVHGLIELRGAEYPFEQYDAAPDAGCAQCERLLETGDGQSIGLPERESGAREAVAIGVGFYDRNDARIAGAGADDAEVVVQGVGVDDGPDERAHRRMPSAYESDT